MGAPARKITRGPRAFEAVVAGRNLVTTIHGHLDFALLDDLFASAEQVLGADEHVAGLVFDCLDVNGFWPGVPARGIQWVRAHTDRVKAIAVVTRSRTLIAVCNAAAVLIPSVKLFTTESRAEAIAATTRMVGPKSKRPVTQKPQRTL